jgi:ElaB/YqjD/DUF883 family membrane-anchored ribosome-binding protein
MVSALSAWHGTYLVCLACPLHLSLSAAVLKKTAFVLHRSNATKEKAMNTDFASSTPENQSIPGNTGRSKGSGSYGSTGQASGASLREELTNLKSDLDALMSHASTLTDRELGEARDKIMSKFTSMRRAAKGVAYQASQQLNRGVDVTSDYVKDRPLQAIAIATGVGLLVGAVLRRH